MASCIQSNLLDLYRISSKLYIAIFSFFFQSCDFTTCHGDKSVKSSLEIYSKKTQKTQKTQQEIYFECKVEANCFYIVQNNFMKIEFQNSVRRLSFLCRLTDIKIAQINPWKRRSYLSEKTNGPNGLPYKSSLDPLFLKSCTQSFMSRYLFLQIASN